jgi:hypothetical protein
MLLRSRTIQYKSVFFNTLPIANTIVVSSSASWQGSNERPAQYNSPQGLLNYQKPSVFYTPSTLFELKITPASWQGSNVRPLQFQHGTEGWLNAQRPSVFQTPIIDKDRGITPASFQGSSVRPLQFQHGNEQWLNAQRPSVFRTDIIEQDRGITAAAFQGSNVRPNPVPWRLNYLDPTYFAQIEPIKFQFPIGTEVINYLFHPVGITFGVSCNYQSEVPITDSFTPETPLPDAFTSETPLVVSWASDSPYCKPGQT